jgi:hypothetical protein
MYPRKQQVSCFYCEWVGRKNKSRDHWKRKQPNKKFKLKISENDLGKYRFQKETIEKTGTTTNDDDTDKNKEQEQANVIILSPCAATSTFSFSILYSMSGAFRSISVKTLCHVSN